MSVLYQNWKSKGTIKVTNPLLTAGFQTSVTIRWAPGMAPDFHDIRFASLKGLKIPYFIESYVSGVSAFIWVALPAKDNLINYFYGNGAALSESSGFKVFDFFADYTNTNIWTYGNVSASGNLIHVPGTINTSTLPLSLTYPWVLEWKSYHNNSGNAHVRFIAGNGTNSIPGNKNMDGYCNTGAVYFQSVVQGTLTVICNPYSKNVTHIHRYTEIDPNTHNYYIYDSDRVLKGSCLNNSYASGADNNPITSFQIYNAGTGTENYLNFVLARKYAVIEPTLTVLWNRPNSQNLPPSIILPNVLTAPTAGFSLSSNFRDITHVWAPINGNISIVSNHSPDSEAINKNCNISIASDARRTEQITGINATINIRGNHYSLEPPIMITSVDMYLHVSIQHLNYLPLPDPQIGSREFRIMRFAGDFNALSWESADVEASLKSDYLGQVDFQDIDSNLSISSLESPIQDFIKIPFPEYDITGKKNLELLLTGQPVEWTNIIIIPPGALSIGVNGPWLGDRFGVNTDLSITTAAGITGQFIRGPPLNYQGKVSGAALKLRVNQTRRDFISYSPREIQIEAAGYVDDLGWSTGKLKIQAQAPFFTEIKYLSGYSILSADLSKTSTDALWNMQAVFMANNCPPEFSGINFSVLDYAGVEQMLFRGMIPDSNPTVSDFGTVQAAAFDYAWYLSTQQIPDDAYIINLQGAYSTWRAWIIHLLEGSGVVPYRIAEINLPDTTISFQGSATKRQAIDAISAYCGCIFEVKYYNVAGQGELPNWNTGAFWVQPENLDDINLGLELPDPVLFEWPNEYMIDLPTISSNPETKYNSVIVRGTDGQGAYYKGIAQTTYVKSGITPAVDLYEENNQCTTQALTDARALELLNHYQNIPFTLSATLIKRFDLRLYQRIKFDTGFPDRLLNLTNTSQPGISYLRIIGINYHTEDANGQVTIKAISDNPKNIILAHQGQGSFTSIDNTEIISGKTVSDNVIYPEIGTIQSVTVDGDGKPISCIVLTEDGKTITARII